MEKPKSSTRSRTRTKKRFFGIISVAVVLIVALGAGYYFRFKSNQTFFKKYGLEILDSYYYRIGRQLNTEILKRTSRFSRVEKDSSNSESLKNKVNVDSITNLAVNDLLRGIHLKNGYLEKPFSEFVIAVIPKKKKYSRDNSIRTKNSLFIEDNFDFEKLLARDSLNNGLVKDYKASGANYLFFGRRYQYKYTFLNHDFACEIVLIGLVDGKSYNKATRELDPWVIAMLLTVLLVSLFGLPFFKMVFIASDERVFSRDVIAAGFAMVVSASLILVIFMSLMEYAHKYNVEFPNNLERMGDSICKRFVKENQANVEALYNFNMGKYGPDTTSFKEVKVEDAYLLEHFKYILGIDSSGNIKRKINLIKRPPAGSFPLNIDDREYVRHFKEKTNLWRAEVGSCDRRNVSYVMRPVVAMESGEEEAVYILDDVGGGAPSVQDTVKSGESRYRVASAQLSSIHLPVMPFGFQYALIDDTENSEVWFHSQPGRSTLEEFFKVSRNANDLHAAIYSRVEAGGRLNYHGSKFLYFIKPVQGTNLNVVVLYDLSLLRLQTSEVISITAMAISISFMAIGMVFLLTLFLKGRKTKLYREERFIFDFLTPKSLYGKRYLFLTLCFGVILVLGAISGWALQFAPFSAFTMGFLDILWSFILVYYVLYPYDRTDYRFYINNILFFLAVVGLNVVLFLKGSGNPYNYLVVLFLQLIFFAMILMAKAGIHYNKKKSTDGLAKDTNLPERSTLSKYIKKVGTWFDGFPLALPHRYSIFLFSWLIAAVLLPALVFYMKAENINELVWVKTNQIHMSKTYLGKQRKLKKILPPIKNNHGAFDYSRIYQRHLDNAKYIDQAYSLTSRKVSGKRNGRDREEGLFRKLLWSTRPIYDEKIRNYKGMVYESAADSSWSSIENKKEIELATLNNSTKADEIFSVWAGMGSVPKLRANIHSYIVLLRVLGVIGILGIVYSVTHFYTNRFFGFRFSDLKPVRFDCDTGYLEDFGRILSCSDSNSGLLLIGLPFSGKENFARRIIEACDSIVRAPKQKKKSKSDGVDKRTAHLSFLKLDVLHKGETIQAILNSIATNPLFQETQEGWDNGNYKKKEYFIIENLEHGLMSLELNGMKLKVISYLIAHKKKVVLTSEVYPNQVFTIYKPFLQEAGGQANNALASDYNSWRNIFGAFPQVLVGMTDQREQVADALATLCDEKGIVDKIGNEVGFSQFLPRLAPIVISKYQRGEFDRQGMILHVQKLAHGYYTDIWNGLPSRERYMLYDLAKDGFMNIKNGNSLFSLMKKGLVVWRDRPSIFNESFQNFIVSFVSKEEALKLETRNRNDSSWGTIKIVMYLMILTLIVFILLGEPGLLDDFEELLAAVGGLGVVLPILSAILGKSGEK